ncbi:unnamed protein product [Pedinophyceae sp. YPF-701]|nr:unnamed protein product [Pedinophyceae sp. YPF-701]
MDGDGAEDAGPSLPLVRSFMEATGSDEQQARFFLEASANNFNGAVQMYRENMGGGGGGGGLFGGPPPPAADDPPGGVPPPVNDAGPRADGEDGNVALQILAAVMQAPIFVLRTGFVLVRGVFGLAWGILDAVGSRVLPSGVWAPVRGVVGAVAGAGDDDADPAEAARAFAAAFERDHGDAHPTFSICSCHDAIRRAHREGRFLLVYLHDRNHQACRDFCAGILTHPSVVELVNSRFVFWAGDVSVHRGARQLQSTLRRPRPPYMALLAPSSRSELSLAAAVEGLHPVSQIVAEIEAAATQHQYLLQNAREARQRHDESRRIREEQDAAFQAALDADRRRAAEAEAAARAEREAAEAAAAAERRAQEEAAAREASAAQAAEARRLARESLPPEPAAGAGGVCQIRVRLPSGGNQARRFLASDTVAAVYRWVDCQEGLPARYVLVSSFPRKEFERGGSEGMTLEGAGLSPQAALFVQGRD